MSCFTKPMDLSTTTTTTIIIIKMKLLTVN
jgi:hypothetical protein